MLIAVIGGSHCSAEIYELARQVGQEIAFALKFGKPVAGLQVTFDLPGMIRATTAEEAVGAVISFERKPIF